MKKDDIRRTVRARKSLLTENEKAEAAQSVFDRLEQMAAFMMADRILMYHSLPDELSTRDFLGKWSGRKHFFLPRVNGVNLDILPYEQTRLHLGAFEIEEPDGNDLTDIADIELIIVPAVAYDRHGNRVGRGKGYYDRMLAGSRATKVGVGYDFQLIDDAIDTDSHDVPVDIVITQSHTVIRRR
ncbi:5-formyltetrahydrofolate cyclo-ligase [Paramuribaculum intestinale]|jgi:5-formyltetrahydrofolate cyclo-ligase|uniref:5-formyltetrahydrofolate cyclo-ligase n=4 Tax=Paramuribaculum intestinale TaxID=2094151 RepID=A0A2V1IUC4_9BACT|nr:5-formyltetrahydrofolate cyclo-ligase [Paramuribaculum intestinale]MBJ2185851.1 5-formyltetrahydrofolate cyclo-ligase [Muribaculaceae bacterium]ROS92487.1 5-formyltetrahydrofolate cyclo-ligase [Muribaculaceae bacterium Isolate-043 (Harlan)]ROT15455.1 5-formyltetrahydrofolate cyclo-ligase [Muribaculaceae bacterium Isolate-105 (HZI)]MCX4329182.1 5-formyltetrahydrofolate cyclo-ligase [Paramuribaculum intestinale]PWB08456.1 5-formyltetrahydrofolate cyclo-ligase [Paramuribaculum intestinale]